MTKFEELNKIYTKAEEDFKEYRWESINFAVQLGKGLLIIWNVTMMR